LLHSHYGTFNAGSLGAAFRLDATTTGPGFRVAAGATKPFVTVAAILLDPRPRFAEAAVVIGRFVAADFAAGFFVGVRKFSGFVASIPMTRR
jgi:hypothetical protein